MTVVSSWAPKVLYFFNSGTNASIMRYDVVFFDSVGVDPGEMGVLKALGPVMSFIGSFFLSRIADSTNRHKVVLMCSMFICICGYLSYILEAIHKSYVALAIIVCINGVTSAAFAPIVDSFVLKVCALHGTSYGSQRLWAAVGWGLCGFLTGQVIEWTEESSMFIIYAVGSFIVLVTTFIFYHGPRKMDALIDEKKEKDAQLALEAAAALKAEKEANLEAPPADNDDAEIDPKAQVVVAVETAPASLEEAGEAPPALGIPATNAVAPSAEDDAAAAAAAVEVTSTITPRVSVTAPVANPPSKNQSRYVLCVLVGNLFLFGMCSAVVEQFLFLFIQKELDGSTSLMGVALFTMTASEVPIFTLADKWVKMFGYLPIFVFCQITFAVRTFCYTLIPAGDMAWLLLILEPLHGITFALMWTASVQSAEDLAPPGREATYQGLIGGVYFGLGIGVGSLIAGLVWEAYGASTLYRSTAVLSLALALVLWVLWPSRKLTDYKLVPAFPSILGDVVERTPSQSSPSLPSSSRTESTADATPTPTNEDGNSQVASNNKVSSSAKEGYEEGTVIVVHSNDYAVVAAAEEEKA